MPRQEKIAAARKRAEEAESRAMVHEPSTEAQLAKKAEFDTYMAYLADFEEISERQRLFLAHLCMTGLVLRACIESGIPLRTVYSWFETKPIVKELADQCKALSADRLERTAIALANGEYMRPLVSQGRIAAYERIYDTKALITLLKARKPEQFQQRIDVTSNGHTLVKLIDKDAWDSV